MNEQVVLVDGNDVELGLMPKLDAHQHGVLHRAFSVFIFNSAGEMLLQQRALDKYHSGGLWSNACCSHPRPGESNVDAAARRLYEEMGIKCTLTEAFSFVYRSELENGLIEHEFDHVFVGVSDDEPQPDPIEVGSWCYLKHEALSGMINDHPEQYTEWFKLCLKDQGEKIFTINK
jgi:isopentenyl-diphosphate delta-isomerase